MRRSFYVRLFVLLIGATLSCNTQAGIPLTVGLCLHLSAALLIMLTYITHESYIGYHNETFHMRKGKMDEGLEYSDSKEQDRIK